MKVALLQLNPTVGNIDENAKALVDAVRRAAADGAELCVAPELSLCGYTPQDLLLSDFFLERCRRKLLQMAEKLADLPPLLLGAPVADAIPLDVRVLDSAVLLRDGKVSVLGSKIFLPNHDVSNDSRYFEPGASPGILTLKGRRFLVLLGEDLLRSQEPCGSSGNNCIEGAVREMGTGVHAIINMSATLYTHELSQRRRAELAAMAKHYRAPVLWVNSVGGSDGLIFEGRSACYGSDGSLLAEAAGFQPDIKLVDLADEEPDSNKNIIEHESLISNVVGTRRAAEFKSGAPMAHPEEIWQALKLGLSDFVGKTIPLYSAPKVIIGISGGIDSALVASLAADTFDPDEVLGVSMPSPFNSPETQRDAAELAEVLGIQFRTLPIGEPFAAFKTLLRPGPLESGGPGERDERGERDGQNGHAAESVDTAMENIQARIRGALLMTLSNQLGGLVLCCGNKSELAMGYCTLYGDTVGALAPVADLYKTQVYRLCHWYNENFPSKAIPQSIVEREPSAELSPGQRDQDSLPPYPVLDSILAAHMEEGLDSEAIIVRGYNPEIVKHVFILLQQSEFKRRQAPPLLRLSAHSFAQGWNRPLCTKYHY